MWLMHQLLPNMECRWKVDGCDMMGASTVYTLTQDESVASFPTRHHLWACATTILTLQHKRKSST